MNNKGFTLVEILAVIVIIALLGILITPGILNVINNSKNASNEILYSNIRTSAIEMYEEIEYMKITFNKYTSAGKQTDEVSIIESNSTKYIEINIQTLVNNGFLSGVSNEGNDNLNSKIVINSDNKDIGDCLIKVIKTKNNNKVSYEIESISDNEICPTTDDLKGD